MNRYVKIITMQAIFLIVVFSVIYALYPKTSMELSGNVVNFEAENANLIIISENPDFSNPRYIDMSENKNAIFELPSGTYYWKSSNKFIQGLENKFTIDSEVGLKINRNESKDNESEIENIGNVKVNITKTKEGIMVGHIILEPEQAEKITDKEDEEYAGRQTE